jgi:hypothetical protein
MGGAILLGFASLKMRTIKFGMMKAEEAPRDYNMAQKVLNDAILALVGYCGGHLIACDYAYKHR